MNPMPGFHQSNRTNAERVRRALRYFRFSKDARLVAEVIVERTVAATPERWTATFIGQKEIMDETSLSKSRVSEAIRELELTKVIVRDCSGRGPRTTRSVWLWVSDSLKWTRFSPLLLCLSSSAFRCLAEIVGRMFGLLPSPWIRLCRPNLAAQVKRSVGSQSCLLL